MDAESFPRINRVVLTGFIQQDPELRYTPGGIPVASFRMRIARLLPENRGAKETVSYITIVAWQELAQKVSRGGRNGQGVAIEGFLHSRSFSTQRGERRTAIEVYADSLQLAPVFLPETAEQPATPKPAPNERRQGGGQHRGGGRGPRRPVEPADAEPSLPFPQEASRRGDDDGREMETSSDPGPSDERQSGFLGTADDAGPAH